MDDTIRLNKYLADMGVCSRREADRLIEAGSVQVNGQAAVMGQKIGGDDVVTVKGKTIGKAKDTATVKRVLLAVNKPVGVVCTTVDKDRAPNIVDMVDYPERIYPIGRLDKDSCGLILMTNDGDLVNRIAKASCNHEKEYIVKVDKIITYGFIEKLQRGVKLEELNATTRPCKAEKIDDKTFRIILTQGLNRQIRRMCQSLGLQVVFLKRIRIVNLYLDSLKPGEYAPLTGEELDTLCERLKRNDSGNHIRKEKV